MYSFVIHICILCVCTVSSYPRSVSRTMNKPKTHLELTLIIPLFESKPNAVETQKEDNKVQRFVRSTHEREIPKERHVTIDNEHGNRHSVNIPTERRATVDDEHGNRHSMNIPMERHITIDNEHGNRHSMNIRIEIVRPASNERR